MRMENNIKRRSRLVTWLGRWFYGSKKELSFLEEEQVTSPTRMMVKQFFHNKIAMTGMVIFIAILLFVTIGPYFLPIDLSYSDSTQQNVPPGLSFQKLPEGLKNNVRGIAPGTTYGVGVSNEGRVYTWGYTRVSETIDIASIPSEVLEADIQQVAAGFDHAVAVDDKGKIYVWGNERLGQGDIPASAKNQNVKQLEASVQYSAIVTQEGKLYLWGNSNSADIKIKKDFQGNVDKIALSDYAYVSLMKGGGVKYTGFNTSTPYAKIPDGLESGVVDIAATSSTFAAVKADGSVSVWGNITHGENIIPAHEGKIVSISGGRYHYTALLDNGGVISWGDNFFQQTKVPSAVSVKGGVTQVFTGYYQNYALTTAGEVEAWGLKGYLLGTDQLGRDMLTRIVNGGKVTMTVGAIAVFIELVIGILVGGLAGYFGKKVDMILMRLAEIVTGMPFLPLALILSSVLASRVSLQQRMYLIMVVLGVLSWPSLARLVRAQILAEREKEFVVAAKAMGVKEMAIVFKHILPNVLSSVLVTITLDFATCMLTESSLSYLGFGIVPPTPTWGNMLTGANNSVVIQQYWWRWVFPAVIFGICTICINLMGDGLRDAVDPKSAER